MAVYMMGKLVTKEPETNTNDNALNKSKCIIKDQFSAKRKGWSQMDATIVQQIASLKEIENIAVLLSMKKSYLYRMIMKIREAKDVRNNKELIDLAIKEEVIKITTKFEQQDYISVDIAREREKKLIQATVNKCMNSDPDISCPVLEITPHFIDVVYLYAELECFNKNKDDK